jgi:hypothetical protein
MSTKTGVAPESRMTFTVDTQLIEGIMTSSPGPMPLACKINRMPAVEDETAIACFAPVLCVIASSNCLTLMPDALQPDFKTSTTASMSLGSTAGLANGRNPLDPCTRSGWRIGTASTRIADNLSHLHFGVLFKCSILLQRLDGQGLKIGRISFQPLSSKQVLVFFHTDYLAPRPRLVRNATN